MTLKKIVLSIFLLFLFGSIVWIGLLYFTYGWSTLKYLARSSPELVWSYTKSMFVVTDLENNSTEISLSTEVRERPRANLPPSPDKAYIETMSHDFQRLNNCGPVTASMVASTYGISFNQAYSAGILKGSDSDKNVSPHELVAFLQSEGLQVAHRVNGNTEIIEHLVSRGIPVIVEQWLVKSGSDELVGHYRVVRGYDRSARQFTTNDSFNGANFVIPYTQFDEWWRPFNRTYLVVYQNEQEEIVKEILQSDWDITINLEDAIKVAKRETESVGDGYSYFNLGTSYTRLKRYEQAKQAYDVALDTSFPYYFLWYEFGPLETYYRLGEYDRVIDMTDTLLSQAGEVEEARHYRSLVYFMQGKRVEARIEEDKRSAANPRFMPPFE